MDSEPGATQVLMKNQGLKIDIIYSRFLHTLFLLEHEAWLCMGDFIETLTTRSTSAQILGRKGKCEALDKPLKIAPLTTLVGGVFPSHGIIGNKEMLIQGLNSIML